MSNKTEQLQADLDQARSDARALALRLFAVPEDTMAPETREVMERWRPLVLETLMGEKSHGI